MSAQPGGRAVVLGGGPAGLRAARQLRETFAHVIIIDRGDAPAAVSRVRTAGGGAPRLTNVDIMAGYEVVGLIATGDGTTPGGPTVTGVVVVRAFGGRLRREVPADLVVDATGPDGQRAAWLAEVGRSTPGGYRVVAHRPRIGSRADLVGRLLRRVGRSHRRTAA